MRTIRNTIMAGGKRKVCRIFFSGSDVADPYTIAFKGYRDPHCGMVYPYLAAGSTPFHPQGVGMHCESREFITGKHIGKRISFNDCPYDVQKFIMSSI